MFSLICMYCSRKIYISRPTFSNISQFLINHLEPSTSAVSLESCSSHNNKWALCAAFCLNALLQKYQKYQCTVLFQKHQKYQSTVWLQKYQKYRDESEFARVLIKSAYNEHAISSFLLSLFVCQQKPTAIAATAAATPSCGP